MRPKRTTKSPPTTDSMNLIGTSITACSDATTFERNKSVEEEALLKIKGLGLGQHMQIIMIKKM